MCCFSHFVDRDSLRDSTKKRQGRYSPVRREGGGHKKKSVVDFFKNYFLLSELCASLSYSMFTCAAKSLIASWVG